ncbi:hypothetical protein C7K38_01155 [Tetragenococcus osmophilus]|uniref:Uncharacterized protein n=1 Tax=Tetragenococcus osmophilus TaxID=526944 RepID=A0AA37XI84_9ENTE|nr:hypothetical protein [Tetragenococcus osmophilus]AYW47100.1 hypothetical protein C7K38_01155 [Tetragenococcus osmophilus]GMA55175.1 hypothetical protein GCM10025857_65320 [Alicyclobacillus contaminans]GMA71055.1 hypothetical protein GCM10025885_01040 [Tetragenococcus osmophilus]
MRVFFIGLLGVLIGALVVTVAFNLRIRFDQRKDEKRRLLEHKVKEIETLVLLNKKIVEILDKRVIMMEQYTSFNAFDDCYITVDDYIYLHSFAAQNSFYLPNYFLDEFFKRIATRKIVLSPEETVQIGGYTFKGARMLVEELSDELTEMIYEKKNEMKKLSDEPLTYFSKPL